MNLNPAEGGELKGFDWIGKTSSSDVPHQMKRGKFKVLEKLILDEN